MNDYTSIKSRESPPFAACDFLSLRVALIPNREGEAAEPGLGRAGRVGEALVRGPDGRLLVRPRGCSRERGGGDMGRGIDR